MNFEFKVIEKEDSSFLREMLYAALFVPEGCEPFPKSIIDIPEMSKYIDNWGRYGDFGFIAQHCSEPAGAVWGRLFAEDNKGYGFVDNNTPELTIAIIDKYRDKGIGTQLMSQFLILAKNKGFKYISLSVNKQNRAISLYNKTGFKLVSESERAYTMRKEIF